MIRGPRYIGWLTELRFVAILAAIVGAIWMTPAVADPCEGTLPKKGTTFSGVVRYVVDGDGLCIGPPGRPDRWIEIRLADFYAPELREAGGRDAKRRLEQTAMGRMLVCQAGHRSYDRVVASCTIDRKPLGTLLRLAGGIEGGRGRPE